MTSVIMGCFAWGGRIAASVLRGAADVVEEVAGLLDAADSEPQEVVRPDPWAEARRHAAEADLEPEDDAVEDDRDDESGRTEAVDERSAPKPTLDDSATGPETPRTPGTEAVTASAPGETSEAEATSAEESAAACEFSPGEAAADSSREAEAAADDHEPGTNSPSREAVYMAASLGIQLPPREGTRERIAAALGAARDTLDAAAALRRPSVASITAPGRLAAAKAAGRALGARIAPSKASAGEPSATARGTRPANTPKPGKLSAVAKAAPKKPARGSVSDVVESRAKSKAASAAAERERPAKRAKAGKRKDKKGGRKNKK